LATSGWGLKFLDYDNDGDIDLMIANLHPDDLIEKIYDNVAYREPLLLFHNAAGQLKNVTHESGPAFAQPMSARGLDLGDFNNDGAVDVLISCNDEAPVLLQNNAGLQNHWLGLKLIGKKANIDDRSDRQLHGRRPEAQSDESGWRELSLIARSADGIGHRQTRQDGMDRNQMAAAERRCPTVHGSSHRPLHYYSRRSTEVGVDVERESADPAV
jgi:hypothetical protein